MPVAALTRSDALPLFPARSAPLAYSALTSSDDVSLIPDPI